MNDTNISKVHVWFLNFATIVYVACDSSVTALGGTPQLFVCRLLSAKRCKDRGPQWVILFFLILRFIFRISNVYSLCKEHIFLYISTINLIMIKIMFFKLNWTLTFHSWVYRFLHPGQVALLQSIYKMLENCGIDILFNNSF